MGLGWSTGSPQHAISRIINHKQLSTFWGQVRSPGLLKRDTLINGALHSRKSSLISKCVGLGRFSKDFHIRVMTGRSSRHRYHGAHTICSIHACCLPLLPFTTKSPNPQPMGLSRVRVGPAGYGNKLCHHRTYGRSEQSRRKTSQRMLTLQLVVGRHLQKSRDIKNMPCDLDKRPRTCKKNDSPHSIFRRA